MGCILQIVFGMFSDILYLECITLTIVLFALSFDIKEAFLAAIVFGIMNMALKQGVSVWSMMYCVIYPTYTLILGSIKKTCLKHLWLTVIVCGVLSFLTGQLLEIPFLLVSKTVTIYYILLGLKTSLIQGVVASISCAFLFRPLHEILMKINH